MPRFDRTGPEGKGPRTGRGLGRCGSSETSEKQDKERLFGRGRGLGRKGRGRGFRFFRRRSGEDNSDNE